MLLCRAVMPTDRVTARKSFLMDIHHKKSFWPSHKGGRQSTATEMQTESLQTATEMHWSMYKVCANEIAVYRIVR